MSILRSVTTSLDKQNRISYRRCLHRYMDWVNIFAFGWFHMYTPCLSLFCGCRLAIVMMMMGLTPNPFPRPFPPPSRKYYCVCLAIKAYSTSVTGDTPPSTKQSTDSTNLPPFLFLARHVRAMVARKVPQLHPKFHPPRLHHPTRLWRRRPWLRISMTFFMCNLHRPTLSP